MSVPILSVKNVSKIYKTKERTVHALDDVSLDIFQGEILSLLGGKKLRDTPPLHLGFREWMMGLPVGLTEKDR